MKRPRTDNRPGNVHPARRATWIWLLFWLTLATATHAPVHPPDNLKLPQGDKIVHAAGFFLLTCLGGWRLRQAGRLTPATLTAWAGIYTAYAAADEALQPLTGRSASMADFAADLAGILAGGVFLAILHRRKLSEPENVTPP